MATINKIPVTWSGLTGLPGFSVFYSTGASTTAVSAIKAFFTAIAAGFPNALQWTVPGSGDSITDTTGQLTGGWTMSGGGTVSGSGGASPTYAAGTGARVKWLTNAISSGRRVRGATFLCPLTTQYYESNGTILNSYLTTVGTAAGTLVADGTLGVYHRHHPGQIDGAFFLMTGAQVPDQVSSLRSRRT